MGHGHFGLTAAGWRHFISHEVSQQFPIRKMPAMRAMKTMKKKATEKLQAKRGKASSKAMHKAMKAANLRKRQLQKAMQNLWGIWRQGTGTDGDEDLQATYGFQIDLNTSFTGEDSLDISIDAGNGGLPGATFATQALAEFDLNGGSEALTVDGVSYTFPLGGATAFVGDNTDGSMLFTTACAYGGPSNTLDDCANVSAGITGGGLSIGAAYDFDNGFTTAFGAQFVETGIATDETNDSYALNAAYTADNYGVSISYANVEVSAVNDTYIAFNGYYSFDNGLNISAGYEIGDLDNAAATVDETEAYFVGINGEVGPGELGAALGTYGTMEEASGSIPDRMMYEVYYSYAVNDGMTITPLIYTKEGGEVGVTGDQDETGIMVKTSFSF